jgi:cytochrome b involved in lipid metabolism
MDNTNLIQQDSNKVTRSTILLILLVLISGSALAFLLINQNNDNSAQSTISEQPIAQVSQPPIEPSSPPVINPGDIPVPEIIITQEQLLANSNMDSCWTIIDGVVYDITDSIRRGSRFLGDMSVICGKDGTKAVKEGLDGRPPFEEIGIFELYSRPMGRISP